jgi:hypothetical protein
MAPTTTDIYAATQTLFRAFTHLQPRMRGGSITPPRPMNPEALAGCVLHSCIAQLLRDMQARRAQFMLEGSSGRIGWITSQHAK